MIIVLHDQMPRGVGAPGSEFRLSSGTELLNAPYVDQLAAQYRRLGARDVIWADAAGQDGSAEAPATGSGWHRLAVGSLAASLFGRCETVVIADYRLWPDQKTLEAIRNHRRSSSTMTSLTCSPVDSGYRELVTDATDGDGCEVTREYSAKAVPNDGERPVALFARPRSLAVVWTKVVEAITTGDLDRLASIAHCSQARIRGKMALVDTVDDYLALSARLLGSIRESEAGARRIADGVWAMDGASVHPGSRIIGPVLLGKGSRVAEGARVIGPAVIGDGVVIGLGAFVAESILATGACVGEGAQVWRSVIEGQGRVEPKRKVSFVWAAGDSHRRYVPTGSGTRFSAVVVPSKRALLRRSVWLHRFAKRAIDIVGAAAGLAVTLPFYPFIALAIRLETPGPVFFAHRRQTVGGREFGCLKFRSMVHNALALRDELRNEVDGPQFHIQNDQRLTRVGKFLRATNLDEIPQFWNVLVGHMSLVGPRPSPDDENQLCPAWREARLSVRPGLTGLWQLRRTDRSSGDFHQWIQYDTQYVREASLGTDLKLIWETIVQMLRRA